MADDAAIAASGPRSLHSPMRSPAYHKSVGAGVSTRRRSSWNAPAVSSIRKSTPRISSWFCVHRRSVKSAVSNDCTAARPTTGCEVSARAALKSMSNRSFLAVASRNSLCGSEKWIRTLAVSGLISTRSTLSHVASRSATVVKKTVFLRDLYPQPSSREMADAGRGRARHSARRPPWQADRAALRPHWLPAALSRHWQWPVRHRIRREPRPSCR